MTRPAEQSGAGRGQSGALRLRAVQGEACDLCGHATRGKSGGECHVRGCGCSDHKCAPPECDGCRPQHGGGTDCGTCARGYLRVG